MAPPRSPAGSVTKALDFTSPAPDSHKTITKKAVEERWIAKPAIIYHKTEKRWLVARSVLPKENGSFRVTFSESSYASATAATFPVAVLEDVQKRATVPSIIHSRWRSACYRPLDRSLCTYFAVGICIAFAV